MCRYHNWCFFLCLAFKSLAIFLWIEMQRCEKRFKGKDGQLLELMTTHKYIHSFFLFTWKGESGIQNHICLWRNEAKDGGTSSYKIQYDLPPKQSHSAWYGRMEKSIWYHYASYSYFTSEYGNMLPCITLTKLNGGYLTLWTWAKFLWVLLFFVS